MSDGSDQIQVEQDAGFAIVTLNQPQKRNAITRATVAALLACFDRLEADQDVGAVIITGAPPAFSAGGDFGDLIAARDGDSGRLREIYSGFLRVLNSSLPTIAAVNGPAVGAGLNLALACDVRIAATSAKFDTRFSSLGIHPGGGPTWMMTQAVGSSAAKAMLLFGEVFDGPAAERVGLALKCVPDGELLAEARTMARRAASYPRELLQQVKATVRMAGTSPFGEVLEREFRIQAESLKQPPFAAAVAKFTEGGKKK
jgi:enoyl-CoA hydratase